MTRILHLIVFLVGLAAIGWIGVGYLGSNPLALSVTALIGVCYLAGALELLRYQQATRSLTHALERLSEAPAQLGPWLDVLPQGLRNTVRLRIEGERAGLPGPALTPYLVGLLVLLGMLGTFLGMVATLRGTGLALESATDLAAMRASLAAPVKGLGFAFGTSVAGVAASAMLGLLSALCRRARLQAGELLDTKAATTLRGYSLAHQRGESFRLLRSQADTLPLLADRLAAMMASMENQSQALNQRLLDGQQAFYGNTEAVYGRLASSVQTALTHSVAESAQAAGAAIQPAVQTTMQTLARETSAWRDTVTQALQQQMDELSRRLEQTSSTLADHWSQALAEQQQANLALNQDLRATLEQFGASFDGRASALLTDVSARLDTTAATLAVSTEQTASGWSAALADQLDTALNRFAATFESRSSRLLDDVAARLSSTTDSVAQTTAGVAAIWKAALAEQHAAQATLAQDLRVALEQFSTGFDGRATDLVARMDARLDGAASGIAAHVQAALGAWQAALGEQRRGQQDAAQGLHDALQQFSASFETRSAALIDGIATRLEGTARTVTQGTSDTLQHWQAALAEQAQDQARLSDALRATLQDFCSAFDQRSIGLVDNVASRMDLTTEQLAQAWREALGRHEAASASLADAHHVALDAAAERFEAHSAALLATVDQAHGRLHGELATRDEARLATWTESLADVAAALRAEWETTGNRTLARQQEICDSFSAAVGAITALADAQSQRMIGEIEHLLEAASQAPKAAAAMVSELREKLSDSMARDNAMLQERGHLLETVDTLLQAINHASHEQRGAVDALVASSAELLERVGQRFTDHLEGETGKLGAVAEQVTGSAVEVASLGEALGAAVQTFDQANARLIGQLERIEAALAKSLTRSDEQLAYYVAQAREVVDLSLLSQKQIMQQLQQRDRDGAQAT
ncbi:DUF802 domain-containing protein [Bordetella holmesii]|uniref:PF05650 domain protein n=2 Tax=Bordetella holmesii TaxID=35814 RepID=A0A158M5T5_9BORD|nr:DUF802 domain-containing protein [Bordetella holmesii]AHV92105.1 hypothetical protein D560_0888 [Bordetella holmesii ATCC 51541]AIT25554.1 hypothetical protein D558_0874 [Bordetella holmesii 44057]EWM41735.1 hypothetical protein D556_0884 [Bordetella holmesii 41130]EWM46122.1 hypothetical protein D555_0895 [Bordetella holmesii 35009]EWM50274.1 hypothetical protein D557_0117 [Bordetella holmesii 70147]